MTHLETSLFNFRLLGDLGAFQSHLSVQSLEPGLDLVTLRIDAPAPARPPSLTLEWSMPIIDSQIQWNPSVGWNRGNSVEWASGMHSRSATNAPVAALIDLKGRNRLTFAVSDALNALEIKSGVHEETATFLCQVKFFVEPSPFLERYEAVLRIDTRDLPYSDSLRDVGDWWASLPGYTPSPVPEAARLPMYSTWYSFHQDLTPEGIEAQCQMAKELGCAAVIVDDGWQTANSERGYAYCGDWTVAPSRIPDMQAHVQAVHSIGLKYILWYSVPFVGEHSLAWTRFTGKYLKVWDMHGQVGVLDPRFPEVREYLCGLYEAAVREWDLDGFKLDFVDSFTLEAGREDELGDGRDLDSVPEAVDKLLTDVMTRLRALKPDIMIEFRQSYIGPLMRKYGNMFRAGDCPDDPIGNRIRTLDIRLICGDTAAHADMMMWHPDESVESAALQILNTLFAVPQISVLLDKIPDTHRAMVKYWMTFWQTHRDVLLDGVLSPLYPEMLYPVVNATHGRKRLIAAYADLVLDLDSETPPELWLVNATSNGALALEITSDLGRRQLTVCDCMGTIVRTDTLTLTPQIMRLAVPPSGTATLTLIEDGITDNAL